MCLRSNSQPLLFWLWGPLTFSCHILSTLCQRPLAVWQSAGSAEPMARGATVQISDRFSSPEVLRFVHTFTATWHLEWAPWSGLAWWYCGFLHNPVTQQVMSPRTWPCTLTPQSPVALQHRPLPTHRGHRWRIWVIRISRYYLYPLHQWLTVILFTKNKKKNETDGYSRQTHSDGNHLLKLTLQWWSSSPFG